MLSMTSMCVKHTMLLARLIDPHSPQACYQTDSECAVCKHAIVRLRVEVNVVYSNTNHLGSIYVSTDDLVASSHGVHSLTSCVQLAASLQLHWLDLVIGGLNRKSTWLNLMFFKAGCSPTTEVLAAVYPNTK